MALPPGPALPRPVQTLRWVVRPGPLLHAAQARYGDVFSVRLVNEVTWVMLADPEAVRTVFQGDPKVFHAGEGNVALRPLLGPRSLLLLDEEEHLAERRRLLPAFHGERIRGYRELMAQAAAEEIARWPRGTPFPLLPRMQALTLEVILRAVFGVRDERLRAALRALLDWAARRFPVLAPLGPQRIERLGLLRRVLAPVDALLLEEIRRRRAGGTGAHADDVLSLLLEVHDDDRAVRDELLTLLVAGHETTASELSWALERLLRHPAAWARVQAGDGDYADAVVKETLRLRPVLAIVLRRLTEPVELAGHELPPGCCVAPCALLLHRRADLYPDPLAFRPERFLGEAPGTYTWIPFGGGVRRCLGASFAQLEMREVLLALGRDAALRPADPAPEPARRRAVTLTPARGAQVVAG